MTSHSRVFSLSLLILLFLAGCQGRAAGEDATAGKKDGEKEEAPPVPVELAYPSRGQMLATYSGTATIEAFAEADVIAKVGGEVRQLHVEEGDLVRAGQVLATLDGDRLRLELQQTEANLKKLEREYQRNVDLHERGLVSVGAFENIKYELDALKAGYDRARLELSYTRIMAPMDGVISERFIKVGNTIKANDRVFHVTTLDPLIIYLHAPEKEYRKIRTGQVAAVEVDALQGRRFMASVTRISPVIDPLSGTFKITVEVADTSGALKPGMFGRIHIVHEVHENALLVPREALLTDGDEESVFVVKDGKAERRVLQTGLTRDGKVEVLAGLADDEGFVLVGQTGLKDGTAVKVVNGTDQAQDPATAETPAEEAGQAPAGEPEAGDEETQQ